MDNWGLKFVAQPEIQVFLYVEAARDMSKMNRANFAGGLVWSCIRD